MKPHMPFPRRAAPPLARAVRHMLLERGRG